MSEVQALPANLASTGADCGGGVDQNTPPQIGELIYTCARTDRLAARKGW